MPVGRVFNHRGSSLAIHPQSLLLYQRAARPAARAPSSTNMSMTLRVGTKWVALLSPAFELFDRVPQSQRP